MTKRNAILNAAEELFGRDGYHATGVMALAQKAGVTKRTLYKYFSSKEILFQTWLQSKDDWSLKVGIERAEALEDTAFGKVTIFFSFLTVVTASENFFGCSFAKTYLEFFDNPESQGLRVAKAHKQRLQNWFETQVTEMGYENPPLLAERLCIIYEGTLMQCVIAKSNKPAINTCAFVESILMAHRKAS